MTNHEGDDCISSNSVTDNGWKEGEQGTDVNHDRNERSKIDSKGYSDGGSDGSLQLGNEHSSSIHAIDSIEEKSPGLDEEFSNRFEGRELELIEVALQSLQEQSQTQKLVPNEAGSADERIARLLKKVQVVRAQSRQASFNERVSISGQISKVYNEGLTPTRGYAEIGLEELCQVVQASSTAAIMAANAAQAVANSVSRNSRTLENLCMTISSSSKSSRLLRNEADLASDETDEDDNEIVGGFSEKDSQHRQILEIVSRETEITKRAVRQNKITHWVLGFMIVSSFVWRYGVVKFVKNINDTIQNPFQSVADMFEGFKDSAADGLNDSSEMKLPQLKLPNIINPDNFQEQKQKKEESVHVKHKQRKV